MLFTYTLTGWEGAATDARVWADALLRGFSVPEGYYYLADAGYPHCPELLVPFRNVRYHLQEWGAAGVRYGHYFVIIQQILSVTLGLQMQGSYSIFNMLKLEMSLNTFLEFSSSALEFYFSLPAILLTSKHTFLQHFVLCITLYAKLILMKGPYQQTQIKHPMNHILLKEAMVILV
jgi:hypothetical protein